MVCNARNNDSQSSPSNPPMIDATMPTHVSSTIPVEASTVVAAAQSQVGFGSQSYPNTWFFDRNQLYVMPSSFIEDLHTNPSSFSVSLNTIQSPFFHTSKENRFEGESQWGRSEVFGSSGSSEPSAAAED